MFILLFLVGSLCTYPNLVARGHTRTALRKLMHQQLLSFSSVSDELLKHLREALDA